MGNTLEPSENFWGGNDNLIGVVRVRNVTVVKRAAKAALADNMCIAENGGFSTDMLVVDLDEKGDGSSRAIATLSSSSVEIGDESTFKEAAAQ